MVNQIDMLGGRHKSTVQFAVETVSRILGSNVECVILYGSCAMGDYSYSSDVDLLVVVKDLAFNTRLLRTTCTPDDYTLPDVDTHFITSQSYAVCNRAFRLLQRCRPDCPHSWDAGQNGCRCSNPNRCFAGHVPGRYARCWQFQNCGHCALGYKCRAFQRGHCVG